MKSFKILHGFGGRCLKIKDVCMDFEPYFKVHDLVSVHPKSIILGQMTNLNMIFHVVVSVYRLIKIRNSPRFPAEFRNGQLVLSERRVANLVLVFSIWALSKLRVVFVCKAFLHYTPLWRF